MERNATAPITISAKVGFKEYVKLLLGVAYKKPMMWVILGVGLSMLSWVVSYWCGLTILPDPQFYQYTTLGLIFLVQPTVIYLTIRRTYISSNHLSESLEMVFDPKHIRITGQSFYTELAWARIFKVVELREWYMIYQNSLSAILVPKRAFRGGEESAFRRMVRSVNGPKVQLKKEAQMEPGNPLAR
jgi:hypothetical protein